MKIIASVTFLLLSFIIWPNGAWAQVEYDEYGEAGGVFIEYRWQRESFFGRDPYALLNLKLTNRAEDHREIAFVIAFYRDDILIFESEEQIICLKPGESIRGGRADLRFSAEGIRMSTIEEGGFDWDFLYFEVETVPACE